jgi:hypothetical protein
VGSVKLHCTLDVEPRHINNEQDSKKEFLKGRNFELKVFVVVGTTEAYDITPLSL